MVNDDDLFDQNIGLLKPFHEQGQTYSVVRKYVRSGSVSAHVKVMPAAEVARHKMVGADLSHNLWFREQPGFDETYRLTWRDTVLRPSGPAADLHGLGEVWLVAAKALSVDNETIEVVD